MDGAQTQLRALIQRLKTHSYIRGKKKIPPQAHPSQITKYLSYFRVSWNDEKLAIIYNCFPPEKFSSKLYLHNQLFALIWFSSKNVGNFEKGKASIARYSRLEWQSSGKKKRNIIGKRCKCAMTDAQGNESVWAR